MSSLVFVGIGSNIDPQVHIPHALELFAQRVSNLRISPIYKNPAVGFQGAEFLNLVVAFEFAGGLKDISVLFTEIEAACDSFKGSGIKPVARNLDLDLLLFGDLEGNHSGYQLPRPDVYNREFVQRPLLDLFVSSGNAFVGLSLLLSGLKSDLERDIPKSMPTGWSKVSLGEI